MSAQVKDFMTTPVRTIRPDDTVATAIALLADTHVTGLPVVDVLGDVVGVLTSSDVLEAEAEADARGGTAVVLQETLVSEVMTPKPLTIEPEATLKQAAQEMLYGEVHRLLVTLNGKLVGVISQTDIVRAVAGGMA